MNRREAIKLALAGIAGLVIGSKDSPNSSQPLERKRYLSVLKEKVLGFSWEDMQSDTDLSLFIHTLADGYLTLTWTHRLQKEDLVDQNYLFFYRNSLEFHQAVRALKPPPHIRPEALLAYTDYDTQKVLIDLQGVERQRKGFMVSAGVALVGLLWHEWTHLDIEERRIGELIGNPEAYFLSPISRTNEMFKKYRGGEVKTETYYGYARFDEVWIETLTVRRMMDEIRLEEIIAAELYHPNGVDFFSKFTRKYVPLKVLYEMHATSNFEEFAKLVGEKLPGEKPPLEKGITLFTGIHRADSDMIRKTGVFETIGGR